MNPNIAHGIDCLRKGDRDTASAAFVRALDDPDPLVQRIARNRLSDLHPERVFGSTHSYERLYHRNNCPAKNVIWKNHFVWFRHWEEAESFGYSPCQKCKPLRRVLDARSGTFGTEG